MSAASLARYSRHALCDGFLHMLAERRPRADAAVVLRDNRQKIALSYPSEENVRDKKIWIRPPVFIFLGGQRTVRRGGTTSFLAQMSSWVSDRNSGFTGF
jgi:hypothetical protein